MGARARARACHQVQHVNDTPSTPNDLGQPHIVSVFDDIDRDLVGGARGLISHFDYLNTSNRTEAAQVRALVDDLLTRYPIEHREDMRKRLRSIDDIGHLGAFFELAMHELLIRAGCRIVAVEPAVAGTKKVPDFLVETQTSARFYLEATLATGRSQADASAQKRLDQALKTIDAVPSPEFFLHLSTSGMPTAPITGKRLKAQLAGWLSALNYETVAAAWKANEAGVPVFEYREHGARFRISPVPRQRSRGITSSRAIGSRMLPGGLVQPQAPIRDAVVGKATRYGELDLPYIIAVNAMGDYADAESAIDALFRSPAVAFIDTGSRYEHRDTRAPDGAWMGRGGPVNTRVSAVLSTEKLTGWSVGQKRVRMLENPWAQKPLPPISLGVDVWHAESDSLQHESGATLREIFGLPQGWPE